MTLKAPVTLTPVTLVLSQKRCQDKTLEEQPVKLGLTDAAEAILMI